MANASWIDPPLNPQPEVILELTKQEAADLMLLLGNLGGVCEGTVRETLTDSYNSVYSTLYNVGVTRSQRSRLAGLRLDTYQG